MASLVGWRVEWRNSFREYTGVVVRDHDRQLEIFETLDLDVYTFKESQQRILHVICPAIPDFVAYLRRECLEGSGKLLSEVETSTFILKQLSSIKSENDVMISQLFIASKEERAKLKKAKVTNETISGRSPKKSPQDYRKKSPKKSPHRKVKSPKVSAAVVVKHKAGTDLQDSKDDDSPGNAIRQFSEDEDEEERYEDDFHEDDGEDDDDEGDEENSEEESEADEEDGDSDATSSSSEEESGTEDEQDGESGEEDEDEEEDDKINIKVYITSLQDMRGYSVRPNKAGLKKITKSLKKLYGESVVLFFRDAEGDVLRILSASDLSYAHRVSRKQGKNDTLKLFADTGSASAAVQSSSARQSVDSAAHTYSPRLQQRPPSSRATATTATPATAADFLPPQQSTFDVVWKKGEVLGVGSFGTVFGGINLATGERMAIKEVSFSTDRRSIQQAKALQQEVRILSNLSHPHIIKYIGSEINHNTLRIFMEYATDGTLKDALKEFGPFPEPLLRRYTVDILEGLGYLHELKMIHRDIKPANLLVSKGVVKLGDFGCSSSAWQEGTDTNHHTIVGTTVYMAPEVMQAGESAPSSPCNPHSQDPSSSSKGYGRKADIWSVGMTLYELSTGQLPYKSAAAAVYAVCVHKTVPTFPPEYSDVARSFLARCLELDPNVRASCSELKCLPFAIRPGVEEARAQTAAAGGRQVTWSTVKVTWDQSDLSFSQTRKNDDSTFRGSEMSGLDGVGTWNSWEGQTRSGTNVGAMVSPRSFGKGSTHKHDVNFEADSKHSEFNDWFASRPMDEKSHGAGGSFRSMDSKFF